MYKVVLDEKSSYIDPVESGSVGLSFEDAVGLILEYCREASYDLQEAVWELILAEGEDNFSSRVITVH